MLRWSKIMSTGCVWLLVMLLAACGGTGESGGAPQTAAETTKKATTATSEAAAQAPTTSAEAPAVAVDCSDPTLSQAEWIDNCQDAPPQTVGTPELSYEVLEIEFFGEKNGYRIGWVGIQTGQEVALSLMCEEALENSEEYDGFVAEYFDENGELMDYSTSCFESEGAQVAYQEIVMENLESLE